MTYNLTDERKEAIFDQINSLYDLADGVANAIGVDGVEDRSKQFDIAKPLMLQLYSSADRITGIYTSCMKNSTRITATQKQDMENAFGEIFKKLKEFSDNAENLPHLANVGATGLTPALTTPLVDGIRKQRPGTLQNQLQALAKELGETHGGHLVNAALAAGDHTAGLVLAMEKLFGIDRNIAMPKFGMASDIARKGVTVTDDMQVIKAQTDSRFVGKN